MHALDVLGEPVRRRILELVADSEAAAEDDIDGGSIAAGSIAAAISEEFGISQPAVSQHLRVLREYGFLTVHPAGTRRLYAVDPQGVREASEWLTPFQRFWRGPLAALGTELARGKREHRLAEAASAPAASSDTASSDAPDPGPAPRAQASARTTPRNEERPWST